MARTVLVLAVLSLPILLGGACRSTPPPRNPLGERFPDVSGRSLDGAPLPLPGPAGDQPLVVLVGYEMEAQFDLDRWILGLLQAGTPARILEVPTIPGMLPGLFAGRIDAGMRGGIPAEDWGSVVTLYGQGARDVARFTGKDGSRNGRVLLLDAAGVVAWFHDQGYSAGRLLELDARARALAADWPRRDGSRP